MQTNAEWLKALYAALDQLVPGAETKAAADVLVGRYADQLRLVAVENANAGVRRAKIEKLEKELLAAIGDLADTEQPGQEQPGPDLPDVPANDPELPDVPADTPEHDKHPSKRKRKRN